MSMVTVAKRALFIAAAGSALALLNACHVPHIHKNERIEGRSVVTVDAKQRAIQYGQVTTGKGTIEAFCAEPSPDVFSVVAQALSAGGTLGRSADPKTMELALNAAFSSAEQGSTIPRTQTVNMLRELMYRTCERYMNGGINDIELPIQAARDQRLMVSILAIESLAGTVTPKPVVIGAQAAGASGASGGEAAVRLDDAHKDMVAKAAAQQARQKEYDEITTDKKDCEAIADAVAKHEEEKLTSDQKEKKAKCETATSALANAKKAALESANYYADLKGVASGGGIPVSATTSVMTPSAAGGADGARASDVSAVASTIGSIVALNMGQDEYLLFCLKVILRTDMPDEKQACQAYLRVGVDHEKVFKQNSIEILTRGKLLKDFDKGN